MKPLARLGYLAAACALLVTTFALIGPRAVQAAVATLIRDQDTAARHPWAQSCSSNEEHCTITVPPNVEYVIQTEAIEALETSSDTTTKVVDLIIRTETGGAAVEAIAITAPDDGLFQPDDAHYAYQGTATLYADPATQITCKARAMQIITAQGCALSGYYVTLP